MPGLGYRRQASWDDHGESYSSDFDGPDIWLRVRLANPGLYRLSLYFVNMDGHSAQNRQRDYRLEVYPLRGRFRRALESPLLAAAGRASQQTSQIERQRAAGSPPARVPTPRVQSNPLQFPDNPQASAWARWALASPPLAQARVLQFWNGVYVRFVLAGPGQYMVRLNRNSAFNEIISGVFVDPVDTPPPAGRIVTIAGTRCLLPPPRSAFAAAPEFGGGQYAAPRYRWSGTGGAQADAARLWRGALRAFGPAAFGARRKTQLLDYRFALSHDVPATLLANWRWEIDFWTSQDRKVFAKAMNDNFADFLRGYPNVATWLVHHHCLQPNSGKLAE